MRIHEVTIWPEAVTDGLALSCGRCSRPTAIDYRVTDEEWNRTIPKEWRRGVVCFDCFIACGGDPACLVEAQFVGNGITAIMVPAIAYHYEATRATHDVEGEDHF